MAFQLSLQTENLLILKNCFLFLHSWNLRYLISEKNSPSTHCLNCTEFIRYFFIFRIQLKHSRNFLRGFKIHFYQRETETETDFPFKICNFIINILFYRLEKEIKPFFHTPALNFLLQTQDSGSPDECLDLYAYMKIPMASDFLYGFLGRQVSPPPH